jgi:molecular chaperone DnaJ
MAKSYYAILGISSMATPEEIRTAYRRLAKTYHPDYYTGSSDLFRQVQEAYSVLGNAERRRQYERDICKTRPLTVPLRPRRQQPEPLIPDEKVEDLGDISPIRSFETYSPSYDELFDWMWNNFSSMTATKFEEMRTLTLEVTVDRDQARRGGTARIMVPAHARCPLCHGYGRLGPYECHRCSGEGAISGEIPIAVSFPPGLISEHVVILPLQRYGIKNLHLTVLFRVTESV